MNIETVVLRKITKVGDSSGVVLPAEIMRALNLFRGDHLVFRVLENDVIAMRKITDAEMKILKPDVIV